MLIIAACVIALAYLALPGVGPKDVEGCVETTNYTKERCRWEMTR
jgi:hypothetical protein